MFSTASIIRRAPRALAIFALQTLLWVGVALAFATLIQVAGWARWNDALYFSAINWLPWAVIAPVVFWLARRFPFERAHIIRSVPIHLLACLACIVLLVWISAFFAPIRRSPVIQRSPSTTETRAAEQRRRESRERPAEIVVADARPPDTAAAAPPEPAVAVTTGSERSTSERRERWAASRTSTSSSERKDTTRIVTGERKDGSRWSGPPPGSFSRTSGTMSRPPGTSSSAPSLLRRWAFLGSFWPPFSGTLLRANFAVAVYLIIACVAHAIGYYRRAQHRERQALALVAGLNQAKLDALRLQLQPHFLFNTLNAISALVHRNPNAADELIADLSELLRLSLQAAENEVPLSRELELLDCYLAIERTRLGDRLRIDRRIDPAVLDAMVPTFILQPLAENAIRHGIEPRRASGTLTILAERSGEELRLTVADDGVGMKPTEIVPAHRGIGLANAEERLRTLHGAKGRLDITTREGGGVEVQIVLPMRTTAPAAAVVSPA